MSTLCNPSDLPLGTVFFLSNEDGYWYMEYRIIEIKYNDGDIKKQLQCFTECGM